MEKEVGVVGGEAPLQMVGVFPLYTLSPYNYALSRKRQTNRIIITEERNPFYEPQKKSYYYQTGAQIIVKSVVIVGKWQVGKW